MKTNSFENDLDLNNIQAKVNRLYYDIDFLKDELLNKKNLSSLEVDKLLEFVNRLYKEMKGHLKEIEILINKINTKK
jgi:hypothetical protein